jgi:hypothetical protein
MDRLGNSALIAVIVLTSEVLLIDGLTPPQNDGPAGSPLRGCLRLVTSYGSLVNDRE